MAQFVRFRVHDQGRFDALRILFSEVKKDKEADGFRDAVEWAQFIPDAVKPHFYWPNEAEIEDWRQRRDCTPIAINAPHQQIGQTWSVDRVFEALEDGEYDLLSCELVSPETAEMQIEPWSYPYGGLGCLIALAEAFGFDVLGVNECGRYESREELLSHSKSRR